MEVLQHPFFYIAVLAKEQIGLSASSLGAVFTVQMFLFTLTKPLIGYIADYFNKLKIVICFLTLLNITCFFSLFAAPKIDREKFVNSAVIFKENAYNMTNSCDKCKNFLQFTQNSSNRTLMNSSNSTDIELQYQHCVLCCPENENLFNTSDTNFAVNNTEYAFSYVSNAENNKQNCVLFCEQNDSFSANFYSSQDIFHVNTRNCTQLSCLHNTKLIQTEQIAKDGSFVRCSQISPKVLTSYNTNNASENNERGSEIEINDFLTYQFWIFAILFSISNICENANFTLVDTACCESIVKSKAHFGKLRLWGNVGWGFFFPIGGLLNDYTGGFLASTALMVALLLSFLYNITRLDLVKPRSSNTICHDIGNVFRSKEFLSFELVNLINGLGTGIVVYYLAWFLTDLGGSQFLCGLSVTFQSFGGVIPFMFFSDWIIRKVGHYQIISLSLMINGIRFLLYSQLYDPWWVLPIEISHGITYGLYYTALATYGKMKAKPGSEATTQSILFTTHEGLGAGIGCGFAGIGFDYFGTHQTFCYLSAYFGCNFLLSLLLYFFFIRKQKKLLKINPMP